MGRLYKNCNKEDVQDALTESDWGEFYNSRDPNDMWEIMLSIITSHVGRMFPLKSYKVNGPR